MENIYTPAEAVKYLAEQRGIQLSVTALRMRRHRKTVTAAHVAERVSLWTQAELDAIKPGRRGRPKKKQEETS